MSQSFKGRFSAGLSNAEYTQTGAQADYGSGTYRPAATVAYDLTSGNAANQANSMVTREYSITSGSAKVLDLNGTADQDFFGANLAAASVVGIMIVNQPVDTSATANSTNVTITTTLPSVISGTTPSIVLKPGEGFARWGFGATPLAVVTPTSADTITMTNASGATAKVQCVVLLRE